jgi:ribulose kinase
MVVRAAAVTDVPQRYPRTSEWQWAARLNFDRSSPNTFGQVRSRHDAPDFLRSRSSRRAAGGNARPPAANRRGWKLTVIDACWWWITRALR